MEETEALKSKQVNLVWNDDLDKYIEQHLGRKWCLQQDLMADQDTLHVFEVGTDPDATAKVEEWLASPMPKYTLYGHGEVIDTDTILSELCNRGLLPEGDLHVHIWW